MTCFLSQIYDKVSMVTLMLC